VSATEALQALGDDSKSGFADGVWFIRTAPAGLPDELLPRSLAARFGLSQESLDKLLLAGGIGAKANRSTWLKKISGATGKLPRQVFGAYDYAPTHSLEARLR
jgi:hypothetical protein